MIDENENNDPSGSEPVVPASSTGSRRRKTKTDRYGQKIARLNVWMDASVLECADAMAKFSNRSTAQLVELALRKLYNQTASAMVSQFGREQLEELRLRNDENKANEKDRHE